MCVAAARSKALFGLELPGNICISNTSKQRSSALRKRLARCVCCCCHAGVPRANAVMLCPFQALPRNANCTTKSEKVIGTSIGVQPMPACVFSEALWGCAVSK
jgi:hypothetical protein